MKIEAIIFDMDGLLIDSEPLWREAEILAFKKIGYHFTEEMCIETMGMRLDEVVKYWHDRLKWKSPSLKEVEDSIEEEIKALIRSKGKLLPGVIEIIDLFDSKNIPMAVASSSYLSVINVVVDTFDLRKKFNSIHSAEFEKHGKPHPDIFLTAAKAMNVLPKNCLVFEDSQHGMNAAIAAQMPVIVVPDKSSINSKWHTPSLATLSSLSEFSLSLINL